MQQYSCAECFAVNCTVWVWKQFHVHMYAAGLLATYMISSSPDEHMELVCFNISLEFKVVLDHPVRL